MTDASVKLPGERAIAAAAKLQAVRGMNDVLPDEAALWERFEEAVRRVFALYGYRNLRVPIVEPTPLFVRAIGEATDVGLRCLTDCLAINLQQSHIGFVVPVKGGLWRSTGAVQDQRSRIAASRAYR